MKLGSILDGSEESRKEKTEVIYGADNIINSTLELFSVARSTLNNCIDSTGPSVLMIPGHPIRSTLRGDGIIIRILIGTDGQIDVIDSEWLTRLPQIELRYLNKSIQTRLTTIVTDRELSLVIEEKGTEGSSGLGFATYSNSDATVLSHAAVFENLWAQSTIRSPQ